MSIHEGHRARRRELYLKNGLGVFADHEVLELLLFYALPRQDTNPLAHELIRRFGSLEGVLSARPEELAKVDGMGMNAAVLLSVLLPVCRRVREERYGGADTILDSSEKAGAYFLKLYLGIHREQFYEVCTDAKGKLLETFFLGEGNVGSVDTDLRTIAENALRCGAAFVFLAHNHPSGIALPSAQDKASTAAIEGGLRAVGIVLADHIIIADGDFVSMRESGLLLD